MQLHEAIAACDGDPRPAHHYTDQRGDGGTALTRAALFRRVTERAGGLAARGVGPGDRVALIADDVPGFVTTFLGAVWLGAVPVPLPPPPLLGAPDAWRADLDTRVALVRPRLTLSSSEPLSGPPVPVTERPADAPVYLQLTSGSTGAPRAVVVTGASLAANCAAITTGLGLTPADVGVSWLPLHHDMGLVGFVCAALIAAVPVVLLPTAAFARDPGVWMRAVSDFGGTVTFGPSFALARSSRHPGPPLPTLRVLGCGGEPIRPDAVRRFLDVHGLGPEVFVPSYGLAESTLAVSFGRGLSVTDDAVDCGPAFAGHEIAIREGEICLRGPSVAAGYFGEEPFGPWLRTGDRGFLRAGRLHVTGRRKDVLIIRGVNVDPQPVEWAVASVPGVREGGVMAFTRPGPDTEELVVVVEGPAPADLVRAAVTHGFGLAVGDLVTVEPGTLPRTTSGKPRRQEARRRYLAGEL